MFPPVKDGKNILPSDGNARSPSSWRVNLVAQDVLAVRRSDRKMDPAGGGTKSGFQRRRHLTRRMAAPSAANLSSSDS